MCLERTKHIIYEVSTDTVPYPQNINAKDTVKGSCTYSSHTVVVRWLWRWSGSGVSPDYRNKVILSPPNTPFLLPVPIIDHAIIHQLLHYRIKIVLSLLQTSFSVSCKCVGSVIYRLKSRFLLKRMSECYRPSEKNVLNPHTPPNPGVIQNIYSA